MNRGRRRRNLPRRRAANVRLGRLITRASHGIRFNPPVDPPEYVSNPWWPITTVFNVDSNSQIQAIHVYSAVITQLGFGDYVNTESKNIPLEMRLVSVRIWGLHKQPIQLAIYDHVGKKNRFTEISDFGSSVQYSRAGWRYGRIATYDALTAEEEDVLFDVTGASTSQKILVYVQLLIRTANAPAPNLLRMGSDFEQLCSSVQSCSL